jgi:hypothetical protein
MNEGLQYTKSERISFKFHLNEKWQEDEIEEGPGILKLGELDNIYREPRKSTVAG